MLSAHLIKSKNVQRVVVIRHPAGQAPSGVRHDIVEIIGEIPGRHRAEQMPEIARLLRAAEDWIASAAPEAELNPVSGSGALARSRRLKAGHAQSRQERAAMLRAMRAGAPLHDVIASYGKNRVSKALAAHKRLYARYGKMPRKTATKRIAPPASLLRKQIEEERDHAERKSSGQHNEYWAGYWAGRSALARELLQLFNVER